MTFGGAPEITSSASPGIRFARGRYVVRIADSAEDVARAQELRSLAFRTQSPDRDDHDARFRHMLVEHGDIGALVCCLRLQEWQAGKGVVSSYSAQYYDLGALERFPGAMLEMGRFCLHPDHHDPDILRVAWGALTAFVDERGIEMLFGCSSFAGTDADPYLDAFALLRARHLAPDCWRPGRKAPEVFRFGARLQRKPDLRKAMRVMPPLLRTYLNMGGRVSDHAVVDRAMGTLHVFTGLEIGAIPPARKRLLRAVAGEGYL